MPTAPTVPVPMLATAGTALPSGPDWAYEFKWDGVRALLTVTTGSVTITSRLGNDVTGGYPELAVLAEGIEDALVDGEIVAFEAGRPSFGRLQHRMHVRSPRQVAELATTVPVTFIAFDLLRLYGVDLTARPFAERRATLERMAAERPQWTVSPCFDDGPATEQAARTHGLEGVVAKRLASRYRPGARSADWVKVKFRQGGEFVVVGWESDAADAGNTLSSLLLGYYDRDADGDPDGGALRFAGKVGSGLSGDHVALLTQRLRPRAQPAVVDVPPPSPKRRLNWAEPELVVEVTFSEWATNTGRLRHPVFVAIREDKLAREIVRDG